LPREAQDDHRYREEDPPHHLLDADEEGAVSQSRIQPRRPNLHRLSAKNPDLRLEFGQSGRFESGWAHSYMITQSRSSQHLSALGGRSARLHKP
jgi:hypothetical protein